MNHLLPTLGALTLGGSAAVLLLAWPPGPAPQHLRTLHAAQPRRPGGTAPRREYPGPPQA